MALTRIRCNRDLTTLLSRFNHPVNTSLTESGRIRHGSELPQSAKSNLRASLHVSGVRRYPDAPKLPLPTNVSEIFGNETGRFTPERARDIAAPVLLYANGAGNRDNRTRMNFDGNYGNRGTARLSCGDDHVESYDCFGAVSLNSSMQSNVPLPYCSSGKASHFNMPGGQWAKDSKYIAEDMRKSHYKSLKTKEYNKKGFFTGTLTNVFLTRITPNYETRLKISMRSKPTRIEPEKIGPSTAGYDVNPDYGKNRIEKFKIAVREYGSTVIVFHIGISLISLGGCYIAVTSGVDVGAFVKMLFASHSDGFQNTLATSSEFVVAYAIHKLLVPIRVSITLAAAPFIVRYLRKARILKTPVKKVKKIITE